MSSQPRNIKNLKISVEAHEVLKNYCDKKGIKIYRFLENLIFDVCSTQTNTKQTIIKKKDPKDIYGED
jgi:hypothetical protein